MLSAGCERPGSVNSEQFENNPIYKKHKFTNDEKVIEIGVPTPWASVNHIVEVMKRDEILKGELKRLGYTLKFYPFMKGEEINYFMRKGLLEGSIIGDMPTLKMASEGNIKVMSLFHRGSVSLVSRDIYRIEDLKGKRVAYPYGSIAHYFLLNLLKENGVSENDIRHKLLDAKDMFDAIKNNEIDAFTTFEPTTTLYTKIDPTLHTISRSFSSYGFFNIRKDYSGRHEEVITMIIAAQIRAVMWLGESDRNLDRASRWVAEESMKIVSLPLALYIKELNAICSEDIKGNMNAYSAVIGEDAIGIGGDISNEFIFLKMKGFIQKDKEWADVRRNFDTNTALEVARGMKAISARIPR